jgi:hypothetical protein
MNPKPSPGVGFHPKGYILDGALVGAESLKLIMGHLNGILKFIGGMGPFPLHGLPYTPVHAVWTSSV